MRNLPSIKRLIIKIGSSLIASSEGVNNQYIERLAEIVSSLKKEIPYITIVSSGAIAAGISILRLEKRPKDIVGKQICAGVGQARLMWNYEQAFRKYNINVAQVLFTKDDFANKRRFLNIRHSLMKMLENGIVPIINENDIVVIDELKYVETFGDNDHLSALVSGLIEADLLLILTEVDGVYNKFSQKDKGGFVIKDVRSVSKILREIECNTKSSMGTGGMKSKLLATRKALSFGCNVGIINGRDLGNIVRFLKGESIGTYFYTSKNSFRLKKMWLAHGSIIKGKVKIDEGAANALISHNKSLLSSGVVEISGRFNIGDVISIVDINGIEIARGKVRYSSQELSKIAGVKSSEISNILGYKYSDEVVHKDDMVLNIEGALDGDL
ncbi:MAG: glutamate 5-kinase [Deferribacterota bacterium]|nr:glutamate 5-kinase [Deferribacterota bacterium]